MKRINATNLLLATVTVLLALNLAMTFHPGTAQAGGTQYKVVDLRKILPRGGDVANEAAALEKFFNAQASEGWELDQVAGFMTILRK